MEMKLQDKAFNLIKEGIKTIEIRLNDEKRRELKFEDEILFTNTKTNETLKAKVTHISHYISFDALLRDNNFESLGFKDVPYEEVIYELGKFYSKEQEKKYGVIGISIEVID